MGAHGTLEEALQGVAAHFATSSEDEELVEKRRQSRKSKKAKKNGDAEKNRRKRSHKRGGDKEHRKEKKAKRHKKDPHQSEEDSASEGDVEQQLKRGRTAVRITREILQQQPDLKQELRQLLWRVDQGQAVQIAGIPDPTLRQQLGELFTAMHLAKASKGIYRRRAGASPTLMLLGAVLDELQTQPGSSAGVNGAHVPHAPAGAGQEGPSSAAGPSDAGDGAVCATSGHLAVTEGSLQGVQQPSDAGTYFGAEGLASGGADSRGAGSGEAEVGCATAVIGPQLGLLRAPNMAVEVQGSVPDEAQELAAAEEAAEALEEGPAGELMGSDRLETVEEPEQAPPASEAPRRVVGPAMPSAELLAAAAEAKEAMAMEYEEGDDGDLIGPAPPELVAETDEAGDDVRAQEVVRILRVLEAAAQTAGAALERDPYAVLGVGVESTAAEVKKRYWRLSLLIHPDKCGHARANDAFQAVSRAAHDLQEGGKRASIDAAREDAALRKRAAEDAAQQERERQWRVARGTATPEDLRGPVRLGPAAREAWMTELPEAARPSAVPTQTNVTTFSQRGIQERGDTRGWTETPQQKLLRLSAASVQDRLAAPPEEAAASARATAAAGAVDAYNAAARGRTLVEQHQQRLQDEEKQKRRSEKNRKKAEDGRSVSGGGAGGEDASWVGSHPWRPFDREKDLNTGPKPVSKEDILKRAGTLGSRFGGNAAGSRQFL